ncbi:MAG: CBS domain-containing protein [Gemmatimonadota bacterium]|jgi:CBS domain-containing protein
MRICDILRRKGFEVVTIAPDRTVLDAVQTLVEHNIGAVVVVDGSGLAGILSERDVLRLTAQSTDLSTLRVGDVMTSDVVIGDGSDNLREVMDVMTRNRIRHLPVVDGGNLAGLVSIGDLVNALRTAVETENRHLKQYIAGAS